MTWLSTFLPYLVVVSQIAACKQHNAMFKGVHQARLECQRYLGGGANDTVPNFETCGSRCEQLVLRSWSDAGGMVSASYRRYFRPTCDDPDYRNRTRSCIKSGLSSAGNVCSRADVAARCCREQYGFLEARSPKILRMPEVLVTSNLRQCAQIFGVSKEEFKLCQGLWFQVTAKARRVLRCLVLRQGLYNVDNGLDVYGAYLQYSDYSCKKRDFEVSFRRCADRVQVDEFHQVAHTMFHCIPRNASIKFDSVDLLPARLPQLSCLEVVRAKCQNACSVETVAKLCGDAELLTDDSLIEVLNSLDINAEGLLLPPTNLSELLPKVVAECVVTWLNECLVDCSSQGVQVICSQP